MRIAFYAIALAPFWAAFGALTVEVSGDVRDALARHFHKRGGLMFFRFGRFGGSLYVAARRNGATY